MWANNSGGSTSATVTISVIDQVPTLAYSPSSVEMTNNTASSDFPLAPSLNGPGDITSWAINDSALPTGVFFGTTNGTFWGVPTQFMAGADLHGVGEQQRRFDLGHGDPRGRGSGAGVVLLAGRG